jgi:hypothetical protein
MTIADSILLELSSNDALDSLIATMGHAVLLSQNGDGAVTAITEALAHDEVLSRKILEAANSRHFERSTSVPLTSISHAVLLLGLNTLGRLTLTFSLMDKLFEPSQRVEMHVELASAMLACSLAAKLMDRVGPPDHQGAEIATLMKGMGRLITAAYAYNDYLEVVTKTDAGEHEDHASFSVLGSTFEELALNAAVHLKIPANYRAALNHPGSRRVANMTTDLAKALVSSGLNLSDTTVAGSLEGIVETYNISHSALMALTETALREFEGVKAVLKARALCDAEAARFQMAPSNNRRQKPAHASREQALRANESMTQLATRGADPRTVAQAATELLQLMGEFRNVLYCERLTGGTFQARAGAGDCSGLKSRMWIVDLGDNQGVLDYALTKGVSVYLDNVQDASMLSRLPPWVKKSFTGCGSLLFVPLGAGLEATGFLYCDKGSKGSAIPEVVRTTLTSVKASMRLAMERARRIAP